MNIYILLMIDQMIKFAEAERKYWEEVRIEQKELSELDLHGIPIHDAWTTFKEFVNTCSRSNCKKARIITGKGKIREEFEHWVTSNSKIRSCILEKTGGSFIIKFIKPL